MIVPAGVVKYRVVSWILETPLKVPAARSSRSEVRERRGGGVDIVVERIAPQ